VASGGPENQRIHRATEKTPVDALKEEKLKTLPAIPYRPYRSPGLHQQTGFVEFETNRYSVPSSYADISVELFAYPDHLEVMIKGNRIAYHPRVLTEMEKSNSLPIVKPSF